MAKPSKAELILAALGGAENIVEFQPCITRLRATLADPSLVDEAAIKAVGVFGMQLAGPRIQIVVGADADTIASDIEDFL